MGKEQSQGGFFSSFLAQRVNHPSHFQMVMTSTGIMSPAVLRKRLGVGNRKSTFF